MAIGNGVTMKDFGRIGAGTTVCQADGDALGGGVLACPKCDMVMRQKVEMNE